MFKPIPGNSDYLVSLAQEFRDVEGRPVVLPVNSEGKVRLELCGERLVVCPKWISLIAHYEFYFEEPSAKKLFNVIFAEANIKFFKYTADKLPVFKRPMEFVHEGKKYRIIPTHPRYAVTAFGDIIEVVSKRSIAIKNNRVKNKIVLATYPYSFVYDPDRSLYRYAFVHRLVAVAWVKHPNNDFLGLSIVNHKDSDKTNYNAENLEWCSFKHNSQHCYESGIRTDNIKCLVRDFKTGKVIEFNSKSLAALYMNVDKGALNDTNVYLRKGRLYKGRYEFKKKSDETPWFYENRKEKVKQGRYVITVTDQNGNEVSQFHELKDFKKAYGIWNIPNAKDMLAKVRYVYPELKFDLLDYYPAGVIQALCVKTGEIVEDTNITKMAEKIGIAAHLIRRCIRGKETWAYHGYAFRYKKDEPWAKDIEHITITKNKPIVAINTQTNERRVFASIRSASREMGVDDRYWLKSCLEQGGDFKGWRFEYLKMDQKAHQRVTSE